MSSSKGKGKGKSSAEADAGDERPGNDDAPSMLSRVAASASGLTRSAFAYPNTQDLNDQAATLSSSGKVQPVAAGASETFTKAESSGTSRSSTQVQAATLGLRVGQSQDHIQQSETEFSSFLNGIDSLVPPVESDVAFEATKPQLTKRRPFPSSSLPSYEWVSTGPSSPGGLVSLQDKELEEAWSRTQDPTAYRPASLAVHAQERRDGEEVLAILAGSDGMEEQFEGSPEGDESHDWGLSAVQLCTIRSMTKHLPPPPQYARIPAEHPLNLAPNIDDLLPVDDRVHWREQWEGVLTGYTDEVWGDLLPLVKEARQELEEMDSHAKQAPTSGNSTALRRLGAILGHLQSQ